MSPSSESKSPSPPKASPRSDARRASIERNTKETQIQVELDLDGSGQYDVSTGVQYGEVGDRGMPWSMKKAATCTCPLSIAA